MIRRILGGCVLTLLTYTGAYAQADDADLLAKMKREMLMPIVMMEKDDQSTASGFIVFSAMREGIAHTYVLTAFHVLASHVRFAKDKSKGGKKGRALRRPAREESKKAPKEISRKPLQVAVFAYGHRLQDVKRHLYSADIIAYDTGEDIGLVRIDPKAGVFLQVAELAPKDVWLAPFMTVWSVGSAMHRFPFPVVGLLGGMDFKSGKKDVEEGTDVLSSAPIAAGNSGGPLFVYNKAHERFEVIGITYGSDEDDEVKNGSVPHMAYSIPTWKVHDFLEKNGYGFITHTDHHPTP